MAGVTVQRDRVALAKLPLPDDDNVLRLPIRPVTGTELDARLWKNDVGQVSIRVAKRDSRVVREGPRCRHHSGNTEGQQFVKIGEVPEALEGFIEGQDVAGLHRRRTWAAGQNRRG